MAQNAQKDGNQVSTLLGVSSVDQKTPITIYADPVTHRLFVESSGGGVAGSLQKDQFSSTNGQTTFLASHTVAFDIYMSINGAIQTPSTDYSVVGGAYVLNSGIPAGNSVILMYATS